MALSSAEVGTYAQGMEMTLKTLLAGEFTQTLAQVEVRQCGVEHPIVYSGPGLVRQEADGELLLQVLDSGHIDEVEKFQRSWDAGPGFGRLLPESGYFDIEAMDNAGNAWRARRQSIKCRFGHGITEVQVRLRRWERDDDRRLKRSGLGKIWWVPRSVDLPWNEKATLGTSVGFYKLVGEAPGCSWEVSKVEQGVQISFWVEHGDLEFLSTRFWRGLGMLCGQALEPRCAITFLESRCIESIHRPMKVYDRLKNLAPLRRQIIQDAPAANTFLACYLALEPRPNGKGDPGRAIYAFWHRILRAFHEDVENASLTLSVAIEGLIKNVFAPQKASDLEFVATLKQAIQALECLPDQTRAIGVLRGKLEHADQFPPGRFLHEARKAGWLSESHVEAWETMRNKGAHGELLEDDNDALQAHIDRFHSGLDTFYRLMFHAIGYQGTHLAYGLPSVPAMHFPPTTTIPSLPKSDADAAPPVEG